MQDTRKYIINLTFEISYTIIQKNSSRGVWKSHTNTNSLFTEAEAKPEGLLDAARDRIDSQHRGSEPARNLHGTTWLQVARENKCKRCQTDTHTHTQCEDNVKQRTTHSRSLQRYKETEKKQNTSLTFQRVHCRGTGRGIHSVAAFNTSATVLEILSSKMRRATGPSLAWKCVAGLDGVRFLCMLQVQPSTRPKRRTYSTERVRPQTKGIL